MKIETNELKNKSVAELRELIKWSTDNDFICDVLDIILSKTR